MSPDSIPRRTYLKGTSTLAAMATAGLAGCFSNEPAGNGSGNSTQSTPSDGADAQSGGGTVNYGGIATVNAGDWANFKKQHGANVNFVTIGNSPGDLLSTLLAGGGRQLYDLIAPVGGIQPPLASQELIQPIKTDKLKNWDRQYDYWQTDQGRDFISHGGDIYGIPIVWQGDSVAYLPNETGREITSYGALFDEEFKGRTAIEDNYTTAGQKTAMYLKATGKADIDNPRNMTEAEFASVVDFLIEQKKDGQFRTMWSGFQTAVNLMAEKEVVVMDTWEPVVFSLRDKGIKAEYGIPDEGYLLWAMVDYLINPQEEWSDSHEDLVYSFVDWQLDGWYGAKITAQTGYMTNPAAIEYAKNDDEFDASEIEEIHEGVKAKFQEVGGSWQQRWPDNREAYERHWQRLRNA
ncbi:PotD/PotF family extracellular solute-binding protein [Halomarina halobia]|uniref:PotD/PotF family extracellular solute-binding protein n=1 Tax=Halomarina halobia TaxID=3033386 RepID=A0ABD6AFN8_9EURY|nr:extracellular solute-binding protein [Halomarina sp. PSR21]